MLTPMTNCNTISSSKAFDETLQAVGDVWTLRILTLLTEDTARFCQLERGIEGINPVTLTTRLKRLEERGFIQRQVEPDSNAVSYSLTDKGVGIIPILREIKHFAETFLKPTQPELA